MKSKSILLSSCFSFLFCWLLNSIPCFPTVVYAKEQVNKVRWAHAYFPPVTIPHGPRQGEGFYDKITEFIIEKLPQYEHQFELANYRRIIHDIKNKEYICCASLYKTKEREEFVRFSIPVVVVLPNGAIVRKSDADRFSSFINSRGELELDRALATKQFTYGVAGGRVYSGGLDPILTNENYKDFKIERASSPDVFAGLFQMLLAGRVDIIIGYPVEAKYTATQLGGGDDYFHYPVAAETTLEFTLGHVGCPDTEWGHEVIEQVNKILLQHRASDTFLGFYESWLDEETIPFYRNVAASFFAEQDAKSTQ